MLNLIDDGLRGTTSFSPAGVWHNAIGTEIIAAIHNVNEGLGVNLTLYRQAFNHLSVLLPNLNQRSRSESFFDFGTLRIHFGTQSKVGYKKKGELG